MITANEARKLRQKHLNFEKYIMQILNTIGKNIKMACEKGHDNLHWKFDDADEDDVISPVIFRLQRLGYDVRCVDIGRRGITISWHHTYSSEVMYRE